MSVNNSFSQMLAGLRFIGNSLCIYIHRAIRPHEIWRNAERVVDRCGSAGAQADIDCGTHWSSAFQQTEY